MSIELIRKPKQAANPLKALEAAAAGLEFEMERAGEHELHVMLPGVWRDIGLWFTWRPELATLQQYLERANYNALELSPQETHEATE